MWVGIFQTFHRDPRSIVIQCNWVVVLISQIPSILFSSLPNTCIEHAPLFLQSPCTACNQYLVQGRYFNLLWSMNKPTSALRCTPLSPSLLKDFSKPKIKEWTLLTGLCPIGSEKYWNLFCSIQSINVFLVLLESVVVR